MSVCCSRASYSIDSSNSGWEGHMWRFSCSRGLGDTEDGVQMDSVLTAITRDPVRRGARLEAARGELCHLYDWPRNARTRHRKSHG